MVVLTIKNDNLISVLDTISFNTFNILTGRSLDFIKKRNNKNIFLKRENGHLYIYDEQFIVGEYYVKNKLTYKCAYITKGIAVLDPVTESFGIIYSTKSDEFRIL